METKKDKIILVTGATGNQGGAVARRLLDEGWPVRALTRDPAKPAGAALAGLGAEVVKGDLGDRGSMDNAVDGVYGVFAVLTPFEEGTEGEVRQGKILADAAKAAGVEHFVYSSVAGADLRTGIPHFESKREIEKYIQSNFMPVTILRPVFFMYNFYRLEQSILDGTLSLAIKPERPLQMLAVEDFAAFVSIALNDPSGHMGRVMELAGDELTMTQTAECFSRVMGRPVKYVEMPIGEVRKTSPDMAKMFQWFNKKGYRTDIPSLKAIYPELMSLETWLKKTGWEKATKRAAA